MSTWPGIDEFRRVLAAYGHPQDRIDWLAGLVEKAPASLMQLGASNNAVKAIIGTGQQWRTFLVIWRGGDVDIDYRYGRVECLKTANIRPIISLVWQDALRTLGIGEAAK